MILKTASPSNSHSHFVLSGKLQVAVSLFALSNTKSNFLYLYKVYLFISHFPKILNFLLLSIVQSPISIEEGVKVSSVSGWQVTAAILLLVPGWAPMTCSQFLKVYCDTWGALVGKRISTLFKGYLG